MSRHAVRAWALAAVPAISILALYLFAAYFRVTQGKWPSYGDPDAGVLRGAELVVDVAVFVIFSAGLFAPILALPIILYRRRPRGYLVLLGLGWLGLLGVLWLDPGGFLDWYFD